MSDTSTRHACKECGAPFVAQRKFNGGNPCTFMLPTCDCEERETDERVDRMLARLQERRDV